MKKLFFIISFLMLSVVSFGAGVTSEGYAEDNVLVTAEVVDTLGIETFGVDFGTIFQGETKKQPDTTGKIRIIGKGSIIGLPVKYAKLEVKQQGKYVEYNDAGQKFDVQLNKENIKTPNENQKMTAVLQLKPESGVTIKLIPILNVPGITIFGKEGILKVTGSLTAKPTQEVGKYNGYLYVRIKPMLPEAK